MILGRDFMLQSSKLNAIGKWSYILNIRKPKECHDKNTSPVCFEIMLSWM